MLPCREELGCSCDGAVADRQINTTFKSGCKNRLRIDTEICPKQQDTALNLLIKTLTFSPHVLLPASWSWWLSILSSHSSLAQGQPGPLPRSGLEEQPPPLLPQYKQFSKNLVPQN